MIITVMILYKSKATTFVGAAHILESIRAISAKTKSKQTHVCIQRIPTEVSETWSSNALKSRVNMLPETRRLMGETGWQHQYPAQHQKEHPVNNKVTHQATRNKVTGPATWSSAQKSNMEQD